MGKLHQVFLGAWLSVALCLPLTSFGGQSLDISVCQTLISDFNNCKITSEQQGENRADCFDDEEMPNGCLNLYYSQDDPDVRLTSPVTKDDCIAKIEKKIKERQGKKNINERKGKKNINDQKKLNCDSLF